MSDDDRELYKSGINEQQADGIFKKDIEQARRDVQRYVKVDINQEQYDALVSFSYQLGGKQFRESDTVKFLNEGKYEEAADSMQKWGIDAPGALDGDIERRKGEANRFRLGTFKMRVKSL
jgi:lysozyme